MKRHPKLGEQEGQVLRFLHQNGPSRVRDVAEHFPQLARTTVLTVMERLREKGYLQRTKVEGVFCYSPREAEDQLVRRQVTDFVQKTLGGSVNPLFRFLYEGGGLTEEEKKQLEKIADRIGRKGDEE